MHMTLGVGLGSFMITWYHIVTPACADIQNGTLNDQELIVMNCNPIFFTQFWRTEAESTGSLGKGCYSWLWCMIQHFIWLYWLKLLLYGVDSKLRNLSHHSNDIAILLLQLYKSVFNPEIGKDLAFIGFVQPASGGLLSMSEIQSQWLAMIIKGRCTLPSKPIMKEQIAIRRVRTKVYSPS